MKGSFLALGVLTILMVGVVIFAQDHERQRQLHINPPTPTLGPRDRYVRYEVHGEGNSHITLVNRSGETVQYYDHLPYTRDIVALSGQSISVSGQDEGYGEITCRIYLNGTKIQEATAIGKYNTAICSGSVP